MRTVFTDEIIHRERCNGSGIKVTDNQYGNAICPVCYGIVQVSDDGKIEPHTIRVI